MQPTFQRDHGRTHWARPELSPAVLPTRVAIQGVWWGPIWRLVGPNRFSPSGPRWCCRHSKVSVSGAYRSDAGLSKCDGGEEPSLQAIQLPHFPAQRRVHSSSGEMVAENRMWLRSAARAHRGLANGLAAGLHQKGTVAPAIDALRKMARDQAS